jgi:CheY-like chemotaxis protein
MESNRRATTVLVVDPSEDCRQMYRHVLESSGMNVHTAASGREGLGLAVLHLPNLVIVELSLPELDGLELAARLKEQRWTRTVPVVVISADASDVEAESNGVAAVCAKPFPPAQLVALVRKLAAV